VAAPAVRWHDTPPAAWEALLEQDPNASPAQRPGVARAFAAFRSGAAPAWLTIGPEDAPLGGAVCVVERRAGFPWLHALPQLLPGTPLARAGAHAQVDQAVGGAFAERVEALGAVGGEWVFHRPEGPPPDPAALTRLPGETRVLTVALVDVGDGMEAAWGRLARHARQELASARRAGLVAHEAPDALEEVYALHAARWGAGLPLELSRRLLEPEPGGACARLYVTGDRAGLLAGVLVLVHRHEWFAWWSGARDEARPRHAFAALLWSVAEHAAAAGARRLNVGASAGRGGVEGFKRSLGARLVPAPVRWLGPHAAGPLGRGLAMLQARLRRGRARGEPA
jgi:hypothetical protein